MFSRSESFFRRPQTVSRKRWNTSAPEVFILSIYNDLPIADHLADQLEAIETETSATERRRTFIEPEISVPVDVLEATTFFQLTDSGTTN
jgi:hypothetical protein